MTLRIENAVEEYIRESSSQESALVELNELLQEYLSLTAIGDDSHEIAEKIMSSYQYLDYLGHIKKIIESTPDLKDLVGNDVDMDYNLVEILESLTHYN